MSKSIRFFIVGLLLCLVASGVFAQTVEVTSIPTQTLYALNSANTRECPQTSYAVVAKLTKGTVVTADGTAQGQAVNKNNALWYYVTLSDGRRAFVYSGTVKTDTPSNATTVVIVNPPAEQSVTTPAEQPAASGTTDNTMRPANCTQAREWGLTPEQAAKWSHLDRDKDGVACYGD